MLEDCFTMQKLYRKLQNIYKTQSFMRGNIKWSSNAWQQFDKSRDVLLYFPVLYYALYSKGPIISAEDSKKLKL